VLSSFVPPDRPLVFFRLVSTAAPFRMVISRPVVNHANHCPLLMTSMIFSRRRLISLEDDVLEDASACQVPID
jgi:hypothetical protein